MPRLYLLPSTMSDAPVASQIPPANIEIAARLRHFIVENVRTARRFLRRCDPAFPVDDCTFEVLNVNTPASAIPGLLSHMERGEDMGVISEAGCPAVADPGADVVAETQRRRYEVIPLVGPSSIIMSLMGSGFNGQRFAFRGYLPIDDAERQAEVRELAKRVSRIGETQIFIETPYRNNKLVQLLSTILPAGMRLCVASDITGPRQSIITRTAADWRSASYDYSKIPTIFLIGK